MAADENAAAKTPFLQNELALNGRGESQEEDDVVDGQKQDPAETPRARLKGW